MGTGLLSLLESRIFRVIMILSILYALFANDSFVFFGGDKSLDAWVILGTIVVLILFAFELIGGSIAISGYFLGFFFWMDMLATVSLIFDIPAVVEWIERLLASLFGGGETLAAGRGAAAARGAAARAGRAARAAARAARIVRAVKLLKVANFIGRKRDDESEDELEEELQASQVGTLFGDLTTRKVIMIVIVMLIALPVLSSEGLGEPAEVGALNQLEDAKSVVSQTEFDRLVKGYADSHPTVLSLEIDGELAFGPEHANSDLRPQQDIGELRKSEIGTFVSFSGNSLAQFDVTDQRRADSASNLLLTIFIIVLLILATIAFNSDADRLFITPIERMTSMVRELTKNPLAAVGSGAVAEGETGLVQTALTKISGMLQIGFGEAGVSVISQNLSADGDLNAMVPGSRVRAVFGFCDIRSFTDTTECLQEDVMVFVNQIADIIHTAVRDHGGAPNKNIGDAFLLVWKLPDDGEGAEEVAGNALQAFVRAVKEVERSQALHRIVQQPALQRRIPGYEVGMGFGLHVGWAIEGAIGSRFKIDPSYLSPHVNMAARLESGTKQFGVKLLLSEEFFALLPPEEQRTCRKLDNVTVVGSDEPMMLYTRDIDPPGRLAIAEYQEMFNQGVDHYMNGDWPEARETLEACQKLWPEDVPAGLLLDFIGSFGYKSPNDWAGYRVLTEK